MLHQHRVGGIERTRDIVGLGRHRVDLFFREAGRFQRGNRTAGAATGGIQLIGGDRHHGGVRRFPAAFVHLFPQLLTLAFTDFGGRHHHQRHAVHRFALGGDKLIVHGDHFQVVTARFGHDRRAEFRIRRADDKALGSAGRQAVDGVKGFFPVRHGDFDHVETEILTGLVGKFPFGLEPGFLGLLDQKTQLHGLGDSRM
ncbi:hypothetical protein D3C79_490090 [compost metagenome]